VGNRAAVSGGAAALSRRRRTTIALVAACMPALAACGSGFDAQTNQVYQPADGVSDRSGTVNVIDALVVSDGSGSGTVVASLVNTGTQDDVLTEVLASTSSGAPLESADLGRGIGLPAGQAVQLANRGMVTVTASDAAGGEAEPLAPSSYVTLQFVFEQAPGVELTVLVVSNQSDHHDTYENVPLPDSRAAGN
jgi:hypothetical protein